VDQRAERKDKKTVSKKAETLRRSLSRREKPKEGGRTQEKDQIERPKEWSNKNLTSSTAVQKGG